MEIVDQYYQGEWKEKAGFQYLLYTNEEDEKVAWNFQWWIGHDTILKS